MQASVDLILSYGPGILTFDATMTTSRRALTSLARFATNSDLDFAEVCRRIGISVKDGDQDKPRLPAPSKRSPHMPWDAESAGSQFEKEQGA
jgi:hypothetical protein